MKKMLTFFLVAALGLVLTACSGCSTIGGAPVTQAQKIQFACASATTAMDVIAAGVREGKVSASQKAAAVKAGEVLLPICSAEDQPTLDSVKKLALDEAVAQLLQIAGSTKSGEGGAL